MTRYGYARRKPRHSLVSLILILGTFVVVGLGLRLAMAFIQPTQVGALFLLGIFIFLAIKLPNTR